MTDARLNYSLCIIPMADACEVHAVLWCNQFAIVAAKLNYMPIWEKEAHFNWSIVTCQLGSTRSELP